MKQGKAFALSALTALRTGPSKGTRANRASTSSAGDIDLAKFFLEEGQNVGLSGMHLELWKRVAV